MGIISEVIEWNEELERIRERRLRELMRRSSGEDSPALGRPADLNAATFRELVKRHPLVVVDCWAPWCGPCRLIAPIVEELAQKYAGRITFGKLNVDENPTIASEYQIMSIPTLLMFKQGRLVDRIVGALPKNALETRIARLL
ncbi:MAG: thioredoxin [Candidatus Hadarchaeum sp.]|uniref:thioredoxin n=1 Tax=Candidatus Hadarchaeum sp. TaxID=2883567 RepID=UPI003D12A680